MNKKTFLCSKMTTEYNTKRTAVVVPLYKQSLTVTEEFSLKNTLSVLSGHDLYVISPERLSNYINELKEEKELNIKVEYFPDIFFSNISGYNNLLMSVDLYRRFDCYEYLLVVQTDVLVFADQLEKWCDCNYSFIGAPWFKGLTKPILPLSFLGVGNGGFSLRKVPDCLIVLSDTQFRPPVDGKVPLNLSDIFLLKGFIQKSLKFSFDFPPIRLDINEDIFWGVLAPDRYKLFNVPRPEDAISFSFEAAPEYLFELNGYKLPFACHAWEKFNPQFWKDTLKNTGMDLP